MTLEEAMARRIPRVHIRAAWWALRGRPRGALIVETPEAALRLAEAIRDVAGRTWPGKK